MRVVPLIFFVASVTNHRCEGTGEITRKECEKKCENLISQEGSHATGSNKWPIIKVICKSKNPDEAEDSAHVSNNVRSIRSADGPPLEPELNFNHPTGAQVHTAFANCLSCVGEDIFVSSLRLLVNFLTLIM